MCGIIPRKTQASVFTFFTHPYKAGSNTRAWNLDILEALFVRHEVANCGNKIRTVSNSSQATQKKTPRNPNKQTKPKMD